MKELEHFQLAEIKLMNSLCSMLLHRYLLGAVLSGYKLSLILS